jgi:transposase InsO family protein
MNNDELASVHEKWARFRFAVVSPLLAAPPGKGELRAELERLSGKEYVHPVTGDPARFGFSTIERWYYEARRARDPLKILRKKVRSDRGTRPSLTEEHRRAIRRQHGEHPDWTKELHYDNLEALSKEDTSLLPLPSCSTVGRFMRETGLDRLRPAAGRDTEGFRRAMERLDKREVRSFEATHVNALWHADFHHGRLKILGSDGEWFTPIALGIHDDRSRLGCHVQWYDAETSEHFAHGLCQAFQKWELPAVFLTDNGTPLVAAEIEQGLTDLGVKHETTLPYSPYQNGKEEAFWALLEGRLVAMLRGVKNLTLRMLNEATQVWLELEYNRRHHREIRTTPLERFTEGPRVSRESPSGEELRRVFTRRESRRQRKSDGTITIKGIRFEVPSRFRHFDRLVVRYAEWDKKTVYLFDPGAGTFLDRLYPLDREKNADGARRSLTPISRPPEPAGESPGLPPLMRRLLLDFAATGLPFPYLPKGEEDDEGLSALEVVR